MIRTFLLLALFFAMLLAPEAVFNGACSGLLLWYQIIIPTLFPFLVVTSLLLRTNGVIVISRLFYRPFHLLFGTSFYGTFAILAGFLCGYPMGSKIIADLLRGEKISCKEASYLLSFCNNASPSFILTFLVIKTIGKSELILPVFLLLLGTPVLLSFSYRIWHYFILNENWIFSSSYKNVLVAADPVKSNSSQKINFSLLEVCIMNSFESLVKVGGYLIIFSVLLSMFTLLPADLPGFLFLKASLEMTNGLLLLSQNMQNSSMLLPALLSLTAFGGWCAVAQTQTMIEGTNLKILPYIRQKLTAALAVSLLTILYLNFH